MNRRSRSSPMLLITAAVALVAVPACESAVPSGTPAATGDRPGIQIDGTWTAVGGQWTFTGRVDPEGDPTDVVLEIGPGPSTTRRFDTRVPVVQDVTAPGPLTVTTRDLPDIEEICVRFTATNAVGTSWSTPLCVPRDPPSLAPPAAPTVAIDEAFTSRDGEWTFTGRVDPRGDPTEVVLEIGSGPAAVAEFDAHVPVAQNLADAATLTIATRDIPLVEEACVRFTATSRLGSASSEPLCFSNPSPGVDPTR